MSQHKPVEGHTSHKLLKNTCFGCGKDNPDGMHLVFHYDEDGKHAYSDFKLESKYQGPPGHAHGGIIATILDEAMGKVNKLRNVVALTKKMDIEYMKPIPLHAKLRAVGWEKKVDGRKHTNVAEIRDQEGHVLARSEGLFIAIDVEKMFAKFADANQLPDELRQQLVERLKLQQGVPEPTHPKGNKKR
jgi:uncharacterized protein (TIGR00369 family)